jgi:hypothetical protein
MSQRYRVFRRGWGIFYCQDLTTGKQESLRTRDKTEAHRLVAARNESEQAPAFSLQLARVYCRAGASADSASRASPFTRIDTRGQSAPESPGCPSD